MSNTIEVKAIFETKQAEQKMSSLDKSIGKLEAEQTKAIKSQKELSKEIASGGGRATKEFKKSAKAAEGFGKGIDKSTKAVKGFGKGIKTSTKATGGLKKGFKGVGLALKGAGIGIIIGLLVGLKEMMGENQKVTDFFSTAMKGLGIAFNDFFNFITENIDPMIEFVTAIFDDPQQMIEDLGNGIKENLIERFESFIDTLGYAGDAIAKFFQGDFTGAMESAKQAGKEMVDVYTGVNNSVDRIVETVTEAAEAVVNYTKETYKSAEAIVQQEKALGRSEIKSRELQLANQKLAEEQRQIRDDETKSFGVRIAANKKLGEILKKAAEDEKKEIGTRLASLESLQNALGYQEERQLQILALKVEQLDVDERIGGIMSEQLTNTNSLLREQGDITRELSLLGKSEIERLTLEAEQKRDLRIAETELAIQDERDKKEILKNIEQEYANEIIKINKVTAKEEEDLGKKNLTFKQQKAAAEIDIARKTLGLLGMLAEQGSQEAKMIASAQVVFETILGIQSMFTSAARNPITGAFPAYPFIQAGLAAGFGALSIRKINAAPTKGGSTPSFSTPSGAGATPRVPDFSFTNQTNDTSDTGRTNRSYVVNQDIRNETAMIQAINDRARL